MSLARIGRSCGSGAPRFRRRVCGLSLIEVLIALVVVSVGLLGMVGLQTFALRNNNSAYHRSQANNLAYEILDKMRAYRTGATDGEYTLALGGTKSGTSRAAIDVSLWLSSLSEFLPSGGGAIACVSDPKTAAACTSANPVCICVVTVQWDDKRGSGSTDLQQLTLSTRI